MFENVNIWKFLTFSQEFYRNLQGSFWMGSRGFGCAGIISLAPLGARAAGLEHLQGRFFGASFLSPLFRRHLIRGHRGDFYWRLGVETERSGVPYRESKPSAHRHRTARTTRQINGAKSFLG